MFGQSFQLGARHGRDFDESTYRALMMLRALQGLSGAFKGAGETWKAFETSSKEKSQDEALSRVGDWLAENPGKNLRDFSSTEIWDELSKPQKAYLTRYNISRNDVNITNQLKLREAATESVTNINTKTDATIAQGGDPQGAYSMGAMEFFSSVLPKLVGTERTPGALIKALGEKKGGWERARGLLSNEIDKLRPGVRAQVYQMVPAYFLSLIQKVPGRSRRADGTIDQQGAPLLGGVLDEINEDTRKRIESYILDKGAQDPAIAAGILMWGPDNKFKKKALEDFIISDLSLEQLKGMRAVAGDVGNFVGMMKELRHMAGRTKAEEMPGFTKFDEKLFYTPKGASVTERIEDPFKLNDPQYTGFLRPGQFSPQGSTSLEFLPRAHSRLSMRPVGREVGPIADALLKYLKPEARKRYEIPKEEKVTQKDIAKLMRDANAGADTSDVAKLLLEVMKEVPARFQTRTFRNGQKYGPPSPSPFYPYQTPQEAYQARYKEISPQLLKALERALE